MFHFRYIRKYDKVVLTNKVAATAVVANRIFSANCYENLNFKPVGFAILRKMILDNLIILT